MPCWGSYERLPEEVVFGLSHQRVNTLQGQRKEGGAVGMAGLWQAVCPGETADVIPWVLGAGCLGRGNRTQCSLHDPAFRKVALDGYGGHGELESSRGEGVVTCHGQVCVLEDELGVKVKQV